MQRTEVGCEVRGRKEPHFTIMLVPQASVVNSWGSNDLIRQRGNSLSCGWQSSGFKNIRNKYHLTLPTEILNNKVSNTSRLLCFRILPSLDCERPNSQSASTARLHSHFVPYLTVDLSLIGVPSSATSRDRSQDSTLPFMTPSPKNKWAV